jgi:ATP-dependent RNA helicase DeaD
MTDKDLTSSSASGSFEEHIMEPADALPEATLDTIPDSMRRAMKLAGWTDLMPVQAKTIPYMLDGRDLMIQSRTGSGKTGAFVLPILQRLDPNRASCQALVLVPTRELARQVAREAEIMAKDRGIRTAVVYGGVGYGAQLDAFRAGAHLVVGTPGRLLDHLLRSSLTLRDLKVLVFDEADRMLSMGFYPDMKAIQRHLPKGRYSSYMFSATIPTHVMRLAQQFLIEPGFLSLSRDRINVAETENVFYMVPPMEKERCLVRIIEMENPSSAIIFCNTRTTVHFVTIVLQRFGYDADELSSDLSQSARERVMARAQEGRLRFLVATDVAARGIDIPDLSCVVLYEPPEDPEAYIHRIGRTGRAGASGRAISLVSPMEQRELLAIGKRFDIDIQERPLPTDEDVAALVSQRVIALLEARLRERDKLQVERMQRFVPLAQSLGQEEPESGLVTMLLDDYYQQTLHSKPPEPPAAGEQRSDEQSRQRPPRKKPRRGPSRRR